MDSLNEETGPPANKGKSPFGAFLHKLRKRRVIETLAAFIGGGWLLVEVVERLLVGHYGLPERLIDITVVSVVGALLATLVWRWSRSAEKRAGNLRVEVLLVPLLILATAAVDLAILLRIFDISGKRLLVAAVAVGLGIAWIVLKSLQWAAAPTPQPPGQFADSVVPKSPVSVTPEKSIVVLPFDNLSSDPEQEYFSDGLTEEIITDLSHIGELLVISRNSAMTFKGTKKKTKEIASEVNVRYVLEGSVRKAGNNLRITAQLIDALTDTHIWAEKFVGTLDDIFDIQEKVSRSIVDALRLRLSPEERNRLFSQPAKSIKAYDLELKSWYYHNRGTLNDFNRALEYSKQALIEDPSYALAYTDVAMCYWVLGNMGYAPAKEMYPLAKTSATRALELDETLAEAHMVLGCYYREFEWDWSSAENEFRRAIQLKPSDSMIHMTYSWHLAFTNRHEESIAEMRKALECDPLYVLPAAFIGEVLLLAKKSDLAIEQCLKVIERDPEFYMTYWLLGTAYLQKDQNLKAVEAFSKGTIVGERDSSIIAMLGHALGTVGRVHEAREILAELMVRRKESYLSPYWLAMVHIGLGEYDRALDWLQKGYEERAGYMWAIHKYVQFDPLRDNPIFQELCRKMNLIF